MRRHQLVLLSLDLLLIGLATVFARIVRDNLEITRDSFTGLVPYVLLTLAVAVPVLVVSGLNRTIWRLSVLSDYVRVVIAAMVIVLAALALAFAYNRLEGVARSLPVLQAILMAFALVGARAFMVLRHALRKRQPPARQGQLVDQSSLETVLVVGLNRITELYLQCVAEFAADRIKIAGILGNSERHTGRLLQQHQVLGAPEVVPNVLHGLEVHGISVDRIVVTSAFEHLSLAAQKALLEIERTSDIKLELFAEWIKLDDPRDKASRSTLTRQSKDDGPAFSFSGADLDALAHRHYWHVKRVIDIASAACLLVVTGPIALLVAALVAMDVGWPVVFWQQRPGLGGRPFKLYKFRTMAPAHDFGARRLSDSERQTFVGRLIRRTRLDEIPQLFNILVGEMSFVGPRPLLPIDQPSAYGARLLVRPGLTGWAQVQGGRKVGASDKAALDIWYVRNASLRLDTLILLRTVLMAIFGERVSAAAIRRAWYELQQAGICIAPNSAASRHDGVSP
jgi:lipopolysaccharide/colanic/teichoic acid biosynthesis glycosyltransferase